MSREILTKYRTKVIEDFIKIEWFVNTIISQHYLGNVYRKFCLEVLQDELFNFGLRTNILEKILQDNALVEKPKPLVEDIRRLSKIRNFFAHCNTTFHENSEEKEKGGVPHPKKPNEYLDFEFLYEEFSEKFPIVSEQLLQLMDEMGVMYEDDTDKGITSVRLMRDDRMASINLMDVIEKRRAIRKYKPDAVPKECIDQMLEAARLAPSGVNSQPWKFKVVTDPDTREKIFQASRNQQHVRQAPAVIVICADTKSYSRGLKERFKELLKDSIIRKADLDTEYAVKAAFNTAIATEHIALMATSLGLGTCWVHMFDKEAISRLFNLPSWIIPVTLMPVGYPDEDPEPRPRKGIEEITF
jgi:nitroreductase